MKVFAMQMQMSVNQHTVVTYVYIYSTKSNEQRNKLENKNTLMNGEE